MIAILCPSYRRNKLAKRLWDNIGDKATLYFCTDSIDLMDYKGIGIDTVNYLYADPNLPTVHKWNLLAEEALKNPDNKLFMLGADDMYFASHSWAEDLTEAYNKLENKIHLFAFQDSRDELGTPHPVVSREWIEALGYAFPPIFLHWQLDTWAVEIAKANNCFTHLIHHELVHDKPSDRGEYDQTHHRIRSFGWADRDAWVADKMQHLLSSEKARLAACISR